MGKKIGWKKVCLMAVPMGLAVFSGALPSAQAEEADMAEYSLDDIIVTATRTDKSFVDTPANVEVITDKALAEHGFTNAFQAVTNLAQAGGLGCRKTAATMAG